VPEGALGRGAFPNGKGRINFEGRRRARSKIGRKWGAEKNKDCKDHPEKGEGTEDKTKNSSNMPYSGELKTRGTGS